MKDFIVQFLVTVVCELESWFNKKMILYMVKYLQMMKEMGARILKRVPKQTLTEFSIMR